MMYLNNKEESIIGPFMDIADTLEGKLILLKWEDGSQVQGVYDSYMEDETDCDMENEEYEEYWSFVFHAVDLVGTPPVYITEDEYFCVDYRNFPSEILVGEKKFSPFRLQSCSKEFKSITYIAIKRAFYEQL